jgi:hypothetical protein
MTDTFTDAYEILDEFTYDVEQVITKIPDPSSDEDIAHTVQDVLFRDLGAGANYEKLKQVISIIYDHALPTSAQYDKMLSLLVHIVRPKPRRYDIVVHDPVVGDIERWAETLAYRFISSGVRISISESFTLWETEVWDRRIFDIAAKFAENYEHLEEISESGLKKDLQRLFYYAADSKHLFRKVNFDLFVRLVMDHDYMMESVETLLETLQQVAERAKSESLDMQLMAAGLLGIIKERSSAYGAG